MHHLSTGTDHGNTGDTRTRQALKRVWRGTLAGAILSGRTGCPFACLVVMLRYGGKGGHIGQDSISYSRMRLSGRGVRAYVGVEFDIERIIRQRLAGVGVGLRGAPAGVRHLLSASRLESGRARGPVPQGRMPEMPAPGLCHYGRRRGQGHQWCGNGEVELQPVGCVPRDIPHLPAGIFLHARTDGEGLYGGGWLWRSARRVGPGPSAGNDQRGGSGAHRSRQTGRVGPQRLSCDGASRSARLWHGGYRQLVRRKSQSDVDRSADLPRPAPPRVAAGPCSSGRTRVARSRRTSSERTRMPTGPRVPPRTQ